MKTYGKKEKKKLIVTDSAQQYGAQIFKQEQKIAKKKNLSTRVLWGAERKPLLNWP